MAIGIITLYFVLADCLGLQYMIIIINNNSYLQPFQLLSPWHKSWKLGQWMIQGKNKGLFGPSEIATTSKSHSFDYWCYIFIIFTHKNSQKNRNNHFTTREYESKKVGQFEAIIYIGNITEMQFQINIKSMWTLHINFIKIWQKDWHLLNHCAVPLNDIPECDSNASSFAWNFLIVTYSF